MERLNKLKMEFVVNMGIALHEAGASSHRLESILSSTSENLGIKGQFFSTPTSINYSFYIEKKNISRLTRVTPASTNLFKLIKIDEIAEQVYTGIINVDAGLRKIKIIRELGNHYPKLATIAGYAMVSSSVSYLSGGNLSDIALASLLSALVAILNIYRRPLRIEDIFEAVAAFLVTSIVYLLPVKFNIHHTVVLISALIMPLPGYTITMAISELAANHLTSGTSRLMGGMVTVVKLAFGVYLAHKITPPGQELVTLAGIYLPEWYNIVALLITATGFMINFRATFKEYSWMLLACTISTLSLYVFKPKLGAETGTFISAFLVAISSNLFARLMKKPAHIMLAPGTILLVPGVFAFQSIQLLFEKNLIQGIETATNMLIIAIAIVAGILMGNLMVNPKRNL